MNNDIRLIDLLIEIKCSRNERYVIKQRDLDGLYSNSAFGFVALLITSDIHAGPHWAFIPSHKIHPRSYKGKLLTPYKVHHNCLQQLDHLWGEVLLNEELMDKLLNMKKIDFKCQEWWQGLSFSPNQGRKDAIRKIKINEALNSLRSRLNISLKRYASRQEGFLHQCILCFCLNKLGYRTTSNHVGVPDLRTELKLPCDSSDSLLFN